MRLKNGDQPIRRHPGYERQCKHSDVKTDFSSRRNYGICKHLDLAFSLPVTSQFAPLQFKQFAQALGLHAAYGDFGGFFVVHFQDEGGVEPRDDFLDVLRVHEE